VRAGAKVTVASVHDSLTVKCSRGVKLVADNIIQECSDQHWDLIAIPGGMPGAENLRDSNELHRILVRQNEQNGYIAAICAAPAVVLQSKKLIGDKKSTCYPAEKFKSTLSNYQDDIVVVDGNIITSKVNCCVQ
jgi:4-methyl-5(b-hydroxyethyl)-thiazole monophosphate biosynthesis